jgi:hypothetical protein
MVVMIQTSSKEELLAEINNLDESTDSVYINARPSMHIVNTILSSAPNVREIMCPPSLLKQTSTKVLEVLGEKDIKLKHKAVRVGRPKKYTKEDVRKMVTMRRNGVPVKDIAKEMGVPLRTVYYYLKKEGNR